MYTHHSITILAYIACSTYIIAQAYTLSIRILNYCTRTIDLYISQLHSSNSCMIKGRVYVSKIAINYYRCISILTTYTTELKS